MALLAELSIIFALVCRAAGDASNIFNSPGPAGSADNFAANLGWAVGSTQTIEFDTTFNSWNLTLVQQPLGDDLSEVRPLNNITSGGKVGTTSFQWEVSTYGASLSDSPVFFLWINLQDPDGFTSHYFNITAESASTTATSSSAAIASTSATPSASTSLISAPSLLTSNASNAASAAASASSTNSTTIGLGVGLGLGIPLLLAAVGVAIWRTIRARKTREQISLTTGPQHDQIPTAYHKYVSPNKMPGNMERGGLYEAPVDRAPAELPTR